MLNGSSTRSEYDLPTAVTFLLIGLALGVSLSAVFTEPRGKSERSELDIPIGGRRGVQA